MPGPAGVTVLTGRQPPAVRGVYRRPVVHGAVRGGPVRSPGTRTRPGAGHRWAAAGGGGGAVRGYTAMP